MPAAILSVTALFSLWVGSASFFHYLGDPSVSVKTDPFYTDSLVELLPAASGEQASLLAARILSLNPAVVSAYNTKARSSLYSGQWEEMVLYKQKALTLSPYSLAEHLEYFDMLRISYERCLQQGRTDGASACLRLLHEIPTTLASIRSRTSPLGWSIQDQPNLELPSDRLLWLNAHPMYA